jgi:hypothetical protein
MQQTAATAIALLLLTGCATTQFNADLSYVRAAGLGYRNAALYTAGYLFLWNTGTNELAVLENSVSLERKDSPEAPATLRSSSVSGISISGEFGSGAAEVAAEASLSRKIEFTAENAVREDYKAIYGGLAQAYRDGLAKGEDMRARWYVDEATTASSPFRYALVTGLVRASRATASVGGKSGSEIGSVVLDVPGLGSIDVGIDRGAAVECSGQAAPCFFEPTVLKSYIAADGNLNFKVDLGTNRDALSEAFRKL